MPRTLPGLDTPPPSRWPVTLNFELGQIRLQQRRALRTVANGDTVRKANFGEMWTDQAMKDLRLNGFRLVHKNQITDIDTPITKGIDHVFAYTDKTGRERYVIVETKYTIDGTTRTTDPRLTDDDRQMSDGWILGGTMLEEAVSLADERAIRNALASDDPIDRVLASVDIGGNVQFRNLDSNGEGLADDWLPDI